jgi:hypothetical protein
MSDSDPRLISGERIVFSTNKHWAALLIDSAWAIVLILASFALAWVQPDTSTGVLGFFSRIIELIRLGLFFGGCGWIAYNAVAWRTAEYSVTNRRVLGHEGLLRRRFTDTLLTSVSDIRTIIPALGRVLGYGHIRIISSAGEAGMDTFTAVHGADVFKQQVLEQKAGSAAIADGQPTPAPSGAPAAPPSSTDVALEAAKLLGELAQLRDAGAITEDEYQAKKAEWLARI